MSKFIQNNRQNSQNIQADTIIVNKPDNCGEDQNKKNMSLRERIENHLLIFFIMTFAVGFSACFGIMESYMKVTGKKLVDSDLYILKTDSDKEVDEKFISKENYDNLNNLYSDIVSKNKILQDQLFLLQKQKQNGWYSRYDELIKERNGFEIEYQSIINFSTGISNYDSEKSAEKKQELQRKISSREKEINAFLERLNP